MEKYQIRVYEVVGMAEVQVEAGEISEALRDAVEIVATDKEPQTLLGEPNCRFLAVFDNEEVLAR